MYRLFWIVGLALLALSGLAPEWRWWIDAVGFGFLMGGLVNSDRRVEVAERAVAFERRDVEYYRKGNAELHERCAEHIHAEDLLEAVGTACLTGGVDQLRQVYASYEDDRSTIAGPAQCSVCERCGVRYVDEHDCDEADE